LRLANDSLTRQIATTPPKPIRFYLEVGLFEVGRAASPTMLVANRHLRDVLLAKGYHVAFLSFAGGHDAWSWRGTFGSALADLLAGVRPGKVASRTPTADLTVQDLGLSLFVPVLRAAALGGGETAIQTFRELREKTDRYDIDERVVNVLGYRLLYVFAQPLAAIAVLEDNVKHFPQSGNVYDSLGEAQYVAGDRARAAQNYKKSLELDPKNTNAVNLLQQLALP